MSESCSGVGSCGGMFGGGISGSGTLSLCFLICVLIACLTTVPWGVSAQNTVDASMATLCSAGVPSTSNASLISRHFVSAVPFTKSAAFVPSRFSSANSRQYRCHDHLCCTHIAPLFSACYLYAETTAVRYAYGTMRIDTRYRENAMRI